ncbi:aspartyl/glutamyl-tRNA(Asn/Gln) amidotransferase subunit A [Anopheles sinensis]|uniref:Aspartyl/glutamyl-tRNA(Asn/Gln) amidotransferase subunit A n=1 Tax=Anopheles sinensis TaxID=74873 RepID=A0A084W2C1_ANOSI|nr:aspartyl/glutamyl-tRNA(Asn/Gln) amidotransferase subunit A [Anopheles sinensis]
MEGAGVEGKTAICNPKILPNEAPQLVKVVSRSVDGGAQYFTNLDNNFLALADATDNNGHQPTVRP